MMSVRLIMVVVHSHVTTLQGLTTVSVGMDTRWTMIATALVSHFQVNQLSKGWNLTLLALHISYL